MQTPPVQLLRDVLERESLSYAALRARQRSGELHRVRRGAYAEASSADAQRAHLQLVAGTWGQLDSDVVVSHSSAAAHHDLPLFQHQLNRVWVTRPTGGHGRTTPSLRVVQCPLADDEIVVADGIRWTTLARTTVDLARSLHRDEATAVVDAALRAGVTPDTLRELVARYPTRRGIRRALAAIDFGDARSESVGESLSRSIMFRRGLPRPTLQFEVFEGGRFLGRSDFAWEEERLLGEFDGKVKYTSLVRPDSSPAEVLLAEKRREQLLRSAGWWVVRWGFDAIVHPERLEAIISEGFRHARLFKRTA